VRRTRSARGDEHRDAVRVVDWTTLRYFDLALSFDLVCLGFFGVFAFLSIR
jgi:hypothetical protein